MPRFHLQYGRSHSSVSIDAACARAARSQYRTLQAHPAYIAGLWTSRQWEAIVAAFECNFSVDSHVGSAATYVLDRSYARQRIKTRVPVGFCLTATVLFESHLATPGCRSTTTPLAEVRTFFREALLLGDRRFPAVRYRGRVFALSPAFAQASIEALLSALAACPCIQNNSLPLPCFTRLWHALQAQFHATAATPPFSLTFRRQSCAVLATSALDAALALAPLQCLAPESEATAPWQQFCARWAVASVPVGLPFDPANHSSASAPAALSPHIFAQDDSRALTPLAPPEPSSPWVCRFCVASFDCLPSFDLHLASVHQCTPASYPTLLRHALGQAFPRPADALPFLFSLLLLCPVPSVPRCRMIHARCVTSAPLFFICRLCMIFFPPRRTCSAIGVACQKLCLLLLSASLCPTWTATRCRCRPMSSRSPRLHLQIVGSSICIHQRPKLLGKLLPLPPRPLFWRTCVRIAATPSNCRGALCQAARWPMTTFISPCPPLCVTSRPQSSCSSLAATPSVACALCPRAALPRRDNVLCLAMWLAFRKILPASSVHCLTRRLPCLNSFMSSFRPKA